MTYLPSPECNSGVKIVLSSSGPSGAASYRLTYPHGRCAGDTDPRSSSQKNHTPYCPVWWWEAATHEYQRAERLKHALEDIRTMPRHKPEGDRSGANRPVVVAKRIAKEALERMEYAG